MKEAKERCRLGLDITARETATAEGLGRQPLGLVRGRVPRELMQVTEERAQRRGATAA